MNVKTITVEIHEKRNHPNECPEPPPKLCECGCGQPAPIAKLTDRRFGHVRGQPIRFVKGHWANVQPTRSAADRFWEKVEIGAPNDCWTFTAAKNWDGYGSFFYDGRMQNAHRVAWELTYGPIPDGLNALHRCDNPPCCNPNHLFLGTQAENIADMLAKGRQGGFASVKTDGEHKPDAEPF